MIMHHARIALAITASSTRHEVHKNDGSESSKEWCKKNEGRRTETQKGLVTLDAIPFVPFLIGGTKEPRPPWQLFFQKSNSRSILYIWMYSSGRISEMFPPGSIVNGATSILSLFNPLFMHHDKFGSRVAEDDFDYPSLCKLWYHTTRKPKKKLGGPRSYVWLVISLHCHSTRLRFRHGRCHWFNQDIRSIRFLKSVPYTTEKTELRNNRHQQGNKGIQICLSRFRVVSSHDVVVVFFQNSTEIRVVIFSQPKSPSNVFNALSVAFNQSSVAFHHVSRHNWVLIL